MPISANIFLRVVGNRVERLPRRLILGLHRANLRDVCQRGRLRRFVNYFLRDFDGAVGFFDSRKFDGDSRP